VKTLRVQRLVSPYQWEIVIKNHNVIGQLPARVMSTVCHFESLM